MSCVFPVRCERCGAFRSWDGNMQCDVCQVQLCFKMCRALACLSAIGLFRCAVTGMCVACGVCAGLCQMCAMICVLCQMWEHGVYCGVCNVCQACCETGPRESLSAKTGHAVPSLGLFVGDQHGLAGSGHACAVVLCGGRAVPDLCGDMCTCSAVCVRACNICQVVC